MHRKLLQLIKMNSAGMLIKIHNSNQYFVTTLHVSGNNIKMHGIHDMKFDKYYSYQN